jgi:mRNA interferase RelE/StbE
LDWKVKLDTHAVKQLKKLNKQVQQRIVKFLQKRVSSSENPRLFGKPLTGHLSNFWRYRVGDHRLICKIKDKEITVLVINIGHRKEVYKTAKINV